MMKWLKFRFLGKITLKGGTHRIEIDGKCKKCGTKLSFSQGLNAHAVTMSSCWICDGKKKDKEDPFVRSYPNHPPVGEGT